jgi:uncharacterized protein
MNTSAHTTYSSGLYARDGGAIGGFSHLLQSIADILTTPIGSRALRREYGSNLHELIDQPMTERLRLAAVLYTAQALNKWEPRLIVQAVSVSRADTNKLHISLDALYKPLGLPVTLSNIGVRLL